MLCSTIFAMAQMMDPVKISSELKMLKGAEAEIIFSATIDAGWHLYSTDLGNDGPTSAALIVNKLDGAELVGKLKPVGKEVEKFDNMFGMNLRYFEGSGKFVQKIKFTKPNYDIDCYLEYGACNDEMCMPPSQASLVKAGVSPAVAETAKPAAKEVKAEEKKAEEAKVEEKEAEAVKTDTAKTEPLPAETSDSQNLKASNDL